MPLSDRTHWSFVLWRTRRAAARKIGSSQHGQITRPIRFVRVSDTSCPPPCLCHAPPAIWWRPALHPRIAGPRIFVDDPALYGNRPGPYDLCVRKSPPARLAHCCALWVNLRFKASLHRYSPKFWTVNLAAFEGRRSTSCSKIGLLFGISRKGQADTCPKVPNF